MLIGYAQVSKGDDQSDALQLRALQEAGCERIFTEAASGGRWDGSAGHAVLLAAGGTVTLPDGSPFRYGKPGFRNGPFIARGAGLDELRAA